MCNPSKRFAGVKALETNDMREQSQNKLPVSPTNSQDAPKHVEEPQGNGFELVARLSQSRSIEEQDDNYVDSGPTTEFEEAIVPDVAPAEEVQDGQSAVDYRNDKPRTIRSFYEDWLKENNLSKGTAPEHLSHEQFGQFKAAAHSYVDKYTADTDLQVLDDMNILT